VSALAEPAAPAERAEPPEPAPAATGAGRLGPLTLVAALGVLLVAIAYAGARTGETWADPAFWAALVVIVVPIAFRLFGAEATRGERLGLLVVLGLALYAVKVLHSPDGFTHHDELGHLRGTRDILLTGELFGENPIVDAYNFYPAIQAVTAAVAATTGLSVFAAGVLVVGLGRTLLMIGLFAFLERVTGSTRVAAIAVAIYAANPNYIFFDGQYAYESLAIGLAAIALFAAMRASTTGIAVLAIAATVVTHHMTSYALAIALVVLAIAERFRDRPVEAHGPLARLAAFAVTAVGAWWLVAGDATSSELGTSLTGTVTGIWDLISGAATSRQPFAAATGYSDPPLERITGLVSVGVLCGALPFALWATFLRRRDHPALALVWLAALAYPATLGLRLTRAGTETSNRASEFVFVGLGAVLGIAFVHWLARRTDRPGARAAGLRAALAATVAVLVAGGLIVGWAPSSRLPAGYQPGAGARSISPEGVAAARWAGEHLPPESRTFSDGPLALLLAAYGRMNPEGGVIDGKDVASLFLRPAFTSTDEAILRDDRIRFVFVDERITTALPRSGRYFEGHDPRAHRYRTPIELNALDKFDALESAPGGGRPELLDRIFSSGDIHGYDARRLLPEGG
jgi:hypothetical protein